MHCLPQSGDGPRKGGSEKAHSYLLLVRETAPSEAFLICGQNNTRIKNLRMGTWNVRTMLDRITGSDDNARPHRRTALIALELSRFGVDIAALSETRLSGEGSLAEVRGGYTFFWRGYPEGHPRQHGVGLAIKTELMEKITEIPVSISEINIMLASI